VITLSFSPAAGIWHGASGRPGRLMGSWDLRPLIVIEGVVTDRSGQTEVFLSMAIYQYIGRWRRRPVFLALRSNAHGDACLPRRFPLDGKFRAAPDLPDDHVTLGLSDDFRLCSHFKSQELAGHGPFCSDRLLPFCLRMWGVW